MRTSRVTTNSTKLRRSRRLGVSLIEMMVAIVVLALTAAIMLPNVGAEKRSRDAKALESQIANFPLNAETEAVKLKMPVDLRVVGTTLVMEQEPLDGSSATQIQTLDLGTMQVVSAQLNGQDVSVGAWQWQAYPDGSTDEGGIGLLDGTQDRSLMITQMGDVTWKKGQPPLATDNTWTAGQLDARESS